MSCPAPAVELRHIGEPPALRAIRMVSCRHSNRHEPSFH
jgi:hypothetical protein